MTEPPVQRKAMVSARVEEYVIPPIKDLLVMGRHAPIGCIAMRRALELLMKTPFGHIEIQDDVISDILIRQPLLRRLPEEKLTRYVLRHLKPLMGPDEVLHVELEVRVMLEVVLEGGDL